MPSQTMKAVRCHGFGGRHRLEEVDIPRPSKGEVLVRVDASGICAADRAMWDATGPWQLNFPFTPGHEFTGTVVELGDEARERHGLAVDDRAIAELNVSYGNDFYRQRGLYHLTDHMQVLGATLDGGWAQYMLYPAEALIHKVPETLSNEAACYTEPLANAIHGVQRADIQFDDVVVISGAGPIGMGMVQAAALKTPRSVILINPGKPKRELALTLGADYAFAPDDPKLLQAIGEFTGGRGADVFLEASGQTRAFEQGLSLVRKGARMVVFGVYKQPSQVDLNIFGEFKELDIRGGHLAPFTYATALDLMARGKINGDACVTHSYPLAAFERALTRKPDPDELQIKVILEPNR